MSTLNYAVFALVALVLTLACSLLAVTTLSNGFYEATYFYSAVMLLCAGASIRFMMGVQL